jgi:hypothetical protein
MKHVSPIIALLLLAGLCLTTRPAAAAQQTPYWPSEREERLGTIESMIVGTMRKLATAHYYGRDDEAEQLLKNLDVLKSEEARLREPPVHAEESAQR